MKKIFVLLMISAIIVPLSNAASEESALTVVPVSENAVVPPVWEDYVPKKYQNPRSFPGRGKNIAELSVGIALTDLLITAPIGIPMICHSVTKMKNQGWYERKIKFEAGLKQAETIENPQERQEFYNTLLKECKMTK